MTHRFSFAAHKLLENVQEPSLQPPPTMLLQTIDADLHTIKKWAILNSEASSHFLALGAPVRNKVVAKKPIAVMLSDGTQVHSTHTGDLDMPQMSTTARYCHIISGLTKYALI